MITDVRGKEVKVGDTVDFAGGGRGASEFFVGEVTKINPMTIVITQKLFGEFSEGWRRLKGNYTKDTKRKSGMFAILESV